MAYVIGKTSALQTATKAAVDIALAELAAGIIDPPTHEAIMARVQEVKDSLTPELFAQVDADQALSDAQPQPNWQKKGTSGGGKAAAPSGPISLEEARDAVLNFGMFKGLTIGAVADMTSDEVKAYTNGKRDGEGVKYLQWLAGSTEPKQKWASDRAKVVVADHQQVGAALAALARG